MTITASQIPQVEQHKFSQMINHLDINLPVV